MSCLLSPHRQRAAIQVVLPVGGHMLWVCGKGRADHAGAPFLAAAPGHNSVHPLWSVCV